MITLVDTFMTDKTYVNRDLKVKKTKSSNKFWKWLSSKMKIRRGGAHIGGQMPITNLDVKKLGTRRTRLK